MTAYNPMLLQEGDWVSGTTLQDERFIGYIESMNDDGRIRVRLTQCDRTERVGTLAEARPFKLMKLPDDLLSDVEALRGLIEVALITRDREWFKELSERKSAAEAAWPSHANGTGTPGSASGLSPFRRRFNPGFLR
ncbi:hypothetical protein [Paenibacillus mucilaginosus]|uniref:IDEAL domain-containing protein n=2 Tax=Paenibacillus mucilaginosus TaxID=61624 RepID=H6NQK0_9BACL|nr:hypothetical protein [Paenibacillus mucilaginosus]AEI45818.1 hypothetical protein KNP414_07308 [Paenibacillus mucilaginosus KNP414]AFC33468.1 hypothetical protein PM3016_6868 [Paenibacillus mucilaginosus 3016]MCG7215002.1 hypothetical protein [Paenibacillus mucilaginosus]WDM27188.1 hypothetical protein KCX80_33140 [Paenibacillus mucilaginosus]WFA21875.1 hypothetical protein ERY13_34105 [Paenibacillus mucilaginosus]